MPSGFNSSQAGAIVAPTKTKASGFKPKSSVLPATVSQPNYKTRAVRPGGFATGGLLAPTEYKDPLPVLKRRFGTSGFGSPPPMPMAPPPIMADGSANGATGAAGAGSVGAAVGEGASVSGGDAGSVGASVGANAGTAASAADDGGGTYARGGRYRYRRGGRTKRPGFFLGGMFQGSPAQSTQATSSNFNQSTSFDPIYTNYFHDTLNRSEGLYDQMKGKTAEDAIAGFTPDQLAAQQGVRNVQGNWQPYMNAARAGFDQAQGAAAGVGTAGQGAFGSALSGPTALGAASPYISQAGQSWTDPGVAQSWMNPYTKNVTDATVAQAQAAFSGPGGTLEHLTDTFTGGNAGQFGRSRMGDVAGKLTTAFGSGLGQSLGAINAQGYNQGMTGFGNEQNRIAGLGSTMGGLAQGQMSGFGTLGSQMTSAAAQGVQSQIAAGQAQQQLGKDVQGAGYTDLNALMTSGQQQQQLQQQQKTFGMQYPWQLLQTMQGLGQGWNVGSTTAGTSNSNSYGTQQAAQASPAAQIAGGVLGVAGLPMPGGGSLGGNILGAAVGAGGQGAGGASGGAAGGASGGHFDGARFKKEYGAGGYAPVVSGVRAMTAKRQPAIKARMMQQQNGLAPPQMTGFARGGSADVAQDKRMVRKGVWAHERQMHGAKKGELTPLKNLRRGGRARYAEGGDSGYFRFMGDNPAPLEAMTAEERKADRARQRAQRGYWGRTKDDIGEMASGVYDLLRMSPELAREGVRNIDKVPGMVGDAFADAGRQYYNDPLGTFWKGAQHYLPQNIYGRMVDSSRDLFRGLSDDEGTLLSSASAALGASPAGITPQGNVRRALISAFAR